jgi:hypothetical protein
MWIAAGKTATMEELILVEQYFGDRDEAVLVDRYAAALQALQTEDVETWLQDASRMGVNEDMQARFQRDWLGGARVPGLDPSVMETRLREGFIGALQSAMDARLPLSIVLTLNNDAPETFSVDHVTGANAVTVIFSIPLGGMNSGASES